MDTKTSPATPSTSKQRCQSLAHPPPCLQCSVAHPETTKLDCSHMVCTPCASVMIEKSIDLYETAIVQCPQCSASTNLEDIHNHQSPFVEQMARLREFADEPAPAKMPRCESYDTDKPTRHGSMVRPSTDFEKIEFRQPLACRRKSGYSSTLVSSESLQKISIQYELDQEQQAKLSAIHEKKMADLAKNEQEKQKLLSRKRTLDTSHQND